MELIQIDKCEGCFGFQTYEFETFLSGATLIRGYRYNGKDIKELQKYSENGVYHNSWQYEDTDVIFYSPTERVENDIFFFELKKKYLICENENFKFFTNFDFINCHDTLKVIMIQAAPKYKENTFYTWTIGTITNTIETLNKISQETFYEHYRHDTAFIFNAFYGVKQISKNNIIKNLMKIQSENDLPSNIVINF